MRYEKAVFYRAYRELQQAAANGPVLVFVSVADCDSVCAVKILKVSVCEWDGGRAGGGGTFPQEKGAAELLNELSAGGGSPSLWGKVSRRAGSLVRPAGAHASLGR